MTVAEHSADFDREFLTAVTALKELAVCKLVCLDTAAVRAVTISAVHPTAVAWKTVDRTEYDKILAELHELSDIVVENWWDDRWIAMLHLRNIKLSEGIEIVKLMQRRPDSEDAVRLN